MEALEDLEVWRRACRLSVEVFRALSNCRERGLKDQLTRASLSIPSNIAEGYERDSFKSRIQFLRIAKGSCGEVWTQLLIARELRLIEDTAGREFENEVKELSKMLHGLIAHYRSKPSDR